MPNSYSSDSKNDMQTIARALIDKYHIHLQEANIVFIFRDNEKRSKGKVESGEVVKAGELLHHFTGADFVVSVHRYEWDVLLTPEKKAALIDHLLSHCKLALDKDGCPRTDAYDDPVWQTITSDVQVFYDVFTRHGTWNESLETISDIAKKVSGKDSI